MNFKTLTMAVFISCIGGSSFAASGGEALAPEAVARWVTSWEDPRSQEKYTFSTRFSAVVPRGRDRDKHIARGTVPFRISGDLVQVKESRGRILHKRMTGSVVIVVRDIDGKDLFSKKVSLAKFCPS